MSDPIQAYEASKARLLDSLRVTDPSPVDVHRDALGHRSVGPSWGTSSNHDAVHLKLVTPYRPSPYSFLLAHLEKGCSYETVLPEDVVLQCLTGRFRVTDDRGESELVIANGTRLIQAGRTYRYEALEEVYNIMKVSNPHEA